MSHTYKYSDAEVALPPGKWVLRGNVQVYVERPQQTIEDRDAYIAELNGRGLSDRDIGSRLGVSHQTVLRTRVRLGLVATAPKRRRRVTRPDIDPVVVARLIAGDTEDLNPTPRERAQAVRELTERGLSASQVATVLRISKRTVTRIRTRVGVRSVHSSGRQAVA